MPECAMCAAERAAINTEYDRLGLPEAQRLGYTIALAENVTRDGQPTPGELLRILARLKACTSLAELQSLAEDA